MRHYIARAFIADMALLNEMPEFTFGGIVIELTPDRVSANIASYIERKNINRYGIYAGQELNAEHLNSMLEYNFMAEFEPSLSDVGRNTMTDIYEQIARGGEDGVLPAEAEVKVISGEIEG